MFTLIQDWPFLSSRWRQNKFTPNKATDSLCLFFLQQSFQLCLVFSTFSNFVFGRNWGNIWSLFSGFTVVQSIQYTWCSIVDLELLIFAEAKWKGMGNCCDIWWLCVYVELTLIHFIYFERDADTNQLQIKYKKINCLHVCIKKPLEFRYKEIVLRSGEFVYACVGACVSVYSRTCIHRSHMHGAHMLNMCPACS